MTIFINHDTVKTDYWHKIEDERIQCDLCPRYCKLHKGQRGLCFVRQNLENEIVLTSYGRSSGFAIDPIEKNHSIIFYLAHRYFLSVLQAVTLPANFVRIGISANREKWIVL
jgi:hypothetical protein